MAILNCAAFRLISPVGCKGDYESGTDCELTSKASRADYLDCLKGAIKGKERSAIEVSVITGRSRNSAAVKLKRLFNLGLATLVKRREPGKIKPIYFYKLIEEA